MFFIKVKKQFVLYLQTSMIYSNKNNVK